MLPLMTATLDLGQSVRHDHTGNHRKMFLVEGDKVGADVFGASGDQGIGQIDAMASEILTPVEPARSADDFGHGHGMKCVHEPIELLALSTFTHAGIELGDRDRGKERDLFKFPKIDGGLRLPPEKIDHEARIKKSWRHRLRNRND
jgi:hypothetical protein